ncbi:MATE family efflux transporter [Fusicatenibacter sp.]|uniref:MATE family efflux transporter n=1 Tax=Fusicatenibacter sp. TaxID=2773922 RepID=UPI0039996D3F
MTSTASAKKDSAGGLFARYVSQNILGMLGLSAYVLADTFFISLAQGADGITALNLILPLYSLIFAIGSMIGVGSATRFKIYRARGDQEADYYFSNAIIFAVIFGLIFSLAGLFFPGPIVRLLGGTEDIVAIGIPYTRIFMLFGPFFMMNYICNAFVRNDGNPSLAMTATFSSSIFNIVMDYVLMFPLKMGMPGAALATAFSPIVGIGICCIHLFSKKNSVRFRLQLPSLRRLGRACQLGVAAFMGEISSGVTTMVFNFLILGLTGNTGIAAYGVVANVALVATAVFNGISQGSQPLLSDYYGKNDDKSVQKILRLSIITGIAAAVLIILVTNLIPDVIVAVFNNENNAEMASYAVFGVQLYFTGFLFAGFNIIGTGFLSATESAAWAFITSVLRGFVAISLCALLLSALFGMTGVWLAFPVAEFITAVLMVIAIAQNVRKMRTK